MSLIRDEYVGDIIIVYHPPVRLSDDGIYVDEDDTVDIFRETCDRNNIVFLNMRDSFIKAYNEDYSVPYGFMNTSLGKGHLNAKGHELIAIELHKLLSCEGT